MKIKLVMMDGNVYSGNSFDEIVDDMMSNPWVIQEDRLEYMSEVKRRVKLFNGQDVEFKNSQEFVLELVKYAVIKSLTITNAKDDF